MIHLERRPTLRLPTQLKPLPGDLFVGGEVDSDLIGLRDQRVRRDDAAIRPHHLFVIVIEIIVHHGVIVARLMVLRDAQRVFRAVFRLRNVHVLVGEFDVVAGGDDDHPDACGVVGIVVGIVGRVDDAGAGVGGEAAS